MTLAMRHLRAWYFLTDFTQATVPLGAVRLLKETDTDKGIQIPVVRRWPGHGESPVGVFL